MKVTVRDFDSICKFDSAFDMLKDFADEFMGSLTDAGLDVLEGLDDPYDPKEYFIMDCGKTILICDCGEVVGKCDSMDEFVTQTRQYLWDASWEVGVSPWRIYKRENGSIYKTDEGDLVYRNNIGSDFILTEACTPGSPKDRRTYDLIVAMKVDPYSDFVFDAKASPKWFAGASYVQFGDDENLLYACQTYLDEQ